jgi:hypothetical protein
MLTTSSLPHFFRNLSLLTQVPSPSLALRLTSMTKKEEAEEEIMPVPKTEDEPPVETVGNTTGFESRELIRLFEIIDKLRECGVSEDISLPQVSHAPSSSFFLLGTNPPQLVVVGDQSSGKSSVLEALTGIPFPVASTLCTRFATQINFRRTAQESVIITIIPAKDTEPSRAGFLKAFNRKVKELTPDVFGDVLAEVSALFPILAGKG